MSENDWVIDLSKIRSRQGLYEFLNPEFANISKDEKVLTIGAGGKVNELLYHYAEKGGFEIISFDIDENKNPDILGDICTYEFEAESFDTIVMCEVLEHLHAPHLGIETVHHALKKGGKLILTTPFIFPIHDRPYDYFRFTKFGLEHLLSKFHDLFIEERNSALEAIDVLWLRLNKITGKRTHYLKKIIVFTVFYLKRPLTLFLMRYVKTDIMTTGYNVRAIKGE